MVTRAQEVEAIEKGRKIAVQRKTVAVPVEKIYPEEQQCKEVRTMQGDERCRVNKKARRRIYIQQKVGTVIMEIISPFSVFANSHCRLYPQPHTSNRRWIRYLSTPGTEENAEIKEQRGEMTFAFWCTAVSLIRAARARGMDWGARKMKGRLPLWPEYRKLTLTLCQAVG